MRRDRIQIIMGILESLSEGERLVSHIAFSNFLQYGLTRKYIRRLESSGLVKTRREGRKLYVALTEKGRQAYEYARRLTQPMEGRMASKGGVRGGFVPQPPAFFLRFLLFGQTHTPSGQGHPLCYIHPKKRKEGLA